MEEFREMARNQLSARQFKMLETMSMQELNEKAEKKRLKSVKAILDGLQQDLLKIRNARTARQQPKPDHLPASVLEENPLDREMQIMRWQWEKLDAITVGKAFTLSDVIVYKMKLELLFRAMSFDAEKGAAVMSSVFNPSKKEEA
jgi:hypothetical protein